MQLLKPTRQSLAEALGVVVGLIAGRVRRGGTWGFKWLSRREATAALLPHLRFAMMRDEVLHRAEQIETKAPALWFRAADFSTSPPS